MSQLPSGRELDYLIAEKIMGWRWAVGAMVLYPPGLHPMQNVQGHTVPHYSTSIADAWTVFCRFTSRYLWYDDATDTWHCHLDPQRRTLEDCRHHATSEDDTGACAICLAALDVVGVKR